MPPTVVAVEQAKAFRNIICIYGIAANLRAPWIAVLIFCVPPKAAVTVVVAFPSSCWGGTSKLYSWPPAVPASTQPQNSFSGFSGGGGERILQSDSSLCRLPSIVSRMCWPRIFPLHTVHEARGGFTTRSKPQGDTSWCLLASVQCSLLPQW